jgi:hypothetical protein
MRPINAPRPTPSVAFAFLVAIASVLSAPAQATEVDNFTGREALTQDALPVLDAEVNRILERAVQSANRESPDRCNRVILRQEIVRWIGPDPTGLFELWATITGTIQKTSAGYSESVYAGASVVESPAMRIAGIGRSFKLANHVVGTDKLGHFFMQGLGYYKRVKVDGAELAAVLRDEHGEEGIWGKPFTGVKSYGDMSTNYAGYRFWNALNDGDQPYVRCEGNRRWVKQRSFTWADYVNDAWDEAINCSEHAPRLQSAVARNLGSRGLQCPISAERCLGIAGSEHAEYLISPTCRELASRLGVPSPKTPVTRSAASRP